MHPQQLKKKASRSISSSVTNRTASPSISYLQTRIWGSRLQNAARILVLVELSRRLHQAYRQAYDKQAAEWLLPQNPLVTVTVSAQIPPLQQVNCPGAGVTAVSAQSGRRNSVIINYSDGTFELRQGGSRAWRNNNPGNIRPGNLQGEIGSAGGFGVYESEAAGQAAIVQLLSRPAYQALTVGGAIARWAPPVENNTAAYQASVQNATGINAQTQMSTLNQGQLQSVANAIRNVEIWAPGTVTCWRQ